MKRPLDWHSLVAVVSLAFAPLLVVACGGDANPMAPSLPDSSVVFGTSAISGQLLGGGGFSATDSLGGAPRSSNMSGVQVSIDGTSTATSTDSAGRFVLVGVPSGTVNMRIVGGGSNASLAVPGVGTNQHVQLTIQVATNTATVVDERREGLEGFAGMVVAVNGNEQSFTLDAGLTVLTNVNTWWDTGGDLRSFAELARAFEDGAVVKVEGRFAPTPEGRALATAVKAEVGDLDVADMRLGFNREKWSLGWIGSGNSGQGNSAIEAYVWGGPFAQILPESVEMQGPDGTVIPFATGFDVGEHFVARFSKPQAISVAANQPAGSIVEVILRGTLVDGTPWELVADIEITDDDDDDSDDDDGGQNLDPAVAAQAIAEIQEVIDYINGLVAAGDMASNDAKPLITSLESAIGSLEKLHGTPSINKLEAFLNKLDAAEKTGKISSEDADFIEELVEDIIDLLEDAT